MDVVGHTPQKKKRWKPTHSWKASAIQLPAVLFLYIFATTTDDFWGIMDPNGSNQWPLHQFVCLSDAGGSSMLGHQSCQTWNLSSHLLPASLVCQNANKIVTHAPYSFWIHWVLGHVHSSDTLVFLQHCSRACKSKKIHTFSGQQWFIYGES